MNDSSKVQPYHLERGAYLYIRQSSMQQILDNTESTKRQYALRTRAIALGWKEDSITVIDNDQGESGASTARREGFQRLVTDVGMGCVGIVMGLEVSRLARNNVDWHRLLEICALADTLILDEDGVYNPANFNDRLLLGLKGTMSEAELHVLKARLRGGLLNKAQRGELRCKLPIGLIYSEADQVVLDPDSQIRETISYFFETFNRVASASQTVKTFNRENILFPSRGCKINATVIFQPLTFSTAQRILHNPRYAGAFFYGRQRSRRTPQGIKVESKRAVSDWIACIPNAHQGYITWEQYETNLKILENNGRPYEITRNSPPREGVALLQGCAVCGKCGRYMRTRYLVRRGGLEAWYVCDLASGATSNPYCQSIAASPVDTAVGVLVAETMTPEAVELAVEIQKEVEARQKEVEQLRLRAIEKAQFDADLAKRRFMMVDPNNRLVADTLEAEWNESLRELARVQKEWEDLKKKSKTILDNATHKRFITLTTDFKKLWFDPSTPNRERKRMLAHIIEDATLIKLPEKGVTRTHIRFKAGKTEILTTLNPLPPSEQIKTKEEIIELVDRLLDEHIYEEIAEILNERGLRPGISSRRGRENDQFDSKRVAYLTKCYGLKSRYDRLRERGMLTRKELTERLRVHSTTVTSWIKHGIIKAHATNGHYFLYEDPGENPPEKKSSRWYQLADRAVAIQTEAKQNQNTNLKPKEV